MESNKKGINNNAVNNDTKKASNNDWQKKVDDKKENVKSVSSNHEIKHTKENVSKSSSHTNKALDKSNLK